MLRAVLVRKNKISKLIQATRVLPPKDLTNDRMCFCYIVAFGALEYMAESLIKGWIHNNLSYHNERYPGKVRVDEALAALKEITEQSIEANNGIGYGKVAALVGKLAGQSNKDSFSSKVHAHTGGEGALNSAIKRIENVRHGVAHGQLLPSELSPSLDDLENDFNFIYDCLIKNLDDVLPRK